MRISSEFIAESYSMPILFQWIPLLHNMCMCNLTLSYMLIQPSFDTSKTIVIIQGCSRCSPHCVSMNISSNLRSQLCPCIALSFNLQSLLLYYCISLPYLCTGFHWAPYVFLPTDSAQNLSTKFTLRPSNRTCGEN